MKVLCLIDNPIPPGHRWLWKYLPENDDELDFLVTTGAVDRFPKWGKLLNYYPAYLRAGFRALRKTRQTQYDVVAWEGKNGFLMPSPAASPARNHPAGHRRLYIRGDEPLSALARFGLKSVSRVIVFYAG